MVATRPTCAAPVWHPSNAAARSSDQRFRSALLPLLAWMLVVGSALIGRLCESVPSSTTGTDGASTHGRCVSWVFVAPAALYHLLTH